MEIGRLTTKQIDISLTRPFLKSNISESTGPILMNLHTYFIMIVKNTYTLNNHWNLARRLWKWPFYHNRSRAKLIVHFQFIEYERLVQD